MGVGMSGRGAVRRLCEPDALGFGQLARSPVALPAGTLGRQRRY